jgi:hypothetical protein
MKLALMHSTPCATKCYQTVLLPAKLCRHRNTNHPEYKDKDVLFFKRKFGALSCRSLIVKSSKTDNESATEASYRVSYRIAPAEEAHTIAETLIKPCAIEMATCVLGEQFEKNLKSYKLETVQLSNNTVKRRIQDLSTGIEK